MSMRNHTDGSATLHLGT